MEKQTENRTEKQKVLAYITGQLNAGTILKEELIDLADKAADTKEEGAHSYHETSPKNLIAVFYAVGAIITIAGISILVHQHWSEIGFAGRIVATFGISVAAYAAAFMLSRKPELNSIAELDQKSDKDDGEKDPQNILSQVFFVISAALAPVGIYVLLRELNIDFTWPYRFGIACGLLVIFGYAFWARRKNILILITVAFGSWAYYVVCAKILAFDFYENPYKWATMVLGLIYILIAYNLTEKLSKSNSTVQNILYGFGTLGILGAGLFIGGFFNLIFIAIMFAAFYSSIYLKSRTMLVLAALFLIADIIKLTSDYFVHSIGWSVSLIIVGFLIIAIGYITYILNKNYMK